MAELPATFSLAKYDFLRELDAGEWAALLSARLEIHEILEENAQGRACAFLDVLADDELEQAIGTRIAACRESIEEIIEKPQIGLFELAASHVKSNSTNDALLKFGPVTTLTIRDADDIQFRLNSLDKMYERAIGAFNFEEGALTDLDEAEEILKEPFFAAKRAGHSRDLTPQGEGVFSEEGSLLSEPWRALKVDLSSTDDEICASFARWLAAAREIDRHASSGRVPHENVLRRWVADRIVPYVDLTLWAAVRSQAIATPVLLKAIFPDLDLSEDKIRKTTRKNASAWLTRRTMNALARRAADDHGGKFPEYSFD